MRKYSESNGSFLDTSQLLQIQYCYKCANFTKFALFGMWMLWDLFIFKQNIIIADKLLQTRQPKDFFLNYFKSTKVQQENTFTAV